MKIYLYNFAIDTQNDEDFHLRHDIDQKLNLISESLQEISEKLKDQDFDSTVNNPIRAIFIAPEYFFARSCPEYYLFKNRNIPNSRIGRHYSYEDYIKIRQGVTNLSQHYPEILIIPGTIAWKSEALSSGAIDVSYYKTLGSGSPASVPSWNLDNGIHCLSLKNYKTQMNSIGELIGDDDTKINLAYSEYQKETPDEQFFIAQSTLLQSPFSQLIGGDNAKNVFQGKVDIINSVLNPGTDFNYNNFIKVLDQVSYGFAWNTAFFYLNGRKYAEYSKHSDYQESLYERELSVFLPGKDESIITIHELRIGIEICLDHNCDVLKKYILKNKMHNPDLHLVLSACVNEKQSHGDFFIHSSSELSFNKPNTAKTIVSNPPGAIFPNVLQINAQKLERQRKAFLNIQRFWKASRNNNMSKTVMTPTIE